MQIENLYCTIATEFSALASAMHLLIPKCYLWYYWLWLSSIYSMMFLKLLIDIYDVLLYKHRKCIYLCHHTFTLKIHNCTLHSTLDCTYFELYVFIVYIWTILHTQIEQNGYSVIWYVLSFLAMLLFRNITIWFLKKVHLRYLRYMYVFFMQIVEKKP